MLFSLNAFYGRETEMGLSALSPPPVLYLAMMDFGRDAVLTP